MTSPPRPPPCQLPNCRIKKVERKRTKKERKTEADDFRTALQTTPAMRGKKVAALFLSRSQTTPVIGSRTKAYFGTSLKLRSKPSVAGAECPMAGAARRRRDSGNNPRSHFQRTVPTAVFIARSRNDVTPLRTPRRRPAGEVHVMTNSGSPATHRAGIKAGTKKQQKQERARRQSKRR